MYLFKTQQLTGAPGLNKNIYDGLATGHLKPGIADQRRSLDNSLLRVADQKEGRVFRSQYLSLLLTSLCSTRSSGVSQR